MITSPPVWLWFVAGFMVVAGLLLSRSPRASKRVAHLPTWFCALLALAALVGMWFLLNAQFGGQVIQVHLP